MASEPGFVQKLGRAKEHLERLDLMLHRFVEHNPCPYEEQFDTHSKIRRWRVTGEPADTTSLWSPEFGEFFYNLRSALDQLIWATVNRSKKGTPAGNLKFPIYQDPVEFISNTYKPLKSLPSDVLTIVERAQPYNGTVRPVRHSLALLNKLGNLDKHQRPHLATYSLAGWGSYGEFPKDAMPYLGRVKQNTVLLQLPGRTPEEMNVGFTPRFGIAFAEGAADFASADRASPTHVSERRTAHRSALAIPVDRARGGRHPPNPPP